MIDKDKSLIIKKENIFSKISKFLKNFFGIFKKKEIKQEEIETNDINIVQEKQTQIAGENELLTIYLEDYLENIDLDYEYTYPKSENLDEDKRRFFKLYEDVKNGKIDMNYLSGNDLVRINLMLKEEYSLKANK